MRWSGLRMRNKDDQSYTLPSAAYPELSTKGRSYTKEEIETLCAFAKSRGVVLVPEIEMPGHAKSLIAAYPETFANEFDAEHEETKWQLFQREPGLLREAVQMMSFPKNFSFR